jgi:putative Holliday junction resolvase
LSTSTAETCLGFDYGTVRIGVAVGQTLTGTATALVTLNNVNGKPDWDAITALIEEWRPTTLVVGLPLNDDGSAHNTSKAAQRFGNQLHGRYNLPVFTMDERLSSVEAERMLADRKGKKRGSEKHKGETDKLAAKLILESWFSTQG